nr:IS630 family transposase [Pseudomonas syringae pv. theae]
AVRYALRDKAADSTSIRTPIPRLSGQPTRYVWNAKGEEILNKIQRARAKLETVQKK